MKYFLSILLVVFSINSFAGTEGCIQEVTKTAYKAHGLSGGTTMLNRVEATKTFVKPGEDKPYLQGEIWHDKDADFTAKVYEVEITVYSALKLIYAYLVNPQTCETSSIIEVFAD